MSSIYVYFEGWKYSNRNESRMHINTRNFCFENTWGNEQWCLIHTSIFSTKCWCLFISYIFKARPLVMRKLSAVVWRPVHTMSVTDNQRHRYMYVFFKLICFMSYLRIFPLILRITSCRWSALNLSLGFEVVKVRAISNPQPFDHETNAPTTEPPWQITCTVTQTNGE